MRACLGATRGDVHHSLVTLARVLSEYGIRRCDFLPAKGCREPGSRERMSLVDVDMCPGSNRILHHFCRNNPIASKAYTEPDFRLKDTA